jgi:hypothetical protein
VAQFAYPNRRTQALNRRRAVLVATAAVALAARTAEAVASPPLDTRAAFSIDSYAPTPDSASIGGRASFDLSLPGLRTSLQASVEGGGTDAAEDPFAVAQRGQSWTGSQTRLTTAWTPLSGASLKIDLASSDIR